MKQKLTISDILLFTVSGIFDFFQEINDPGGLISNYYKNFCGFVPTRWKKIYLQNAISKNIKKKRIEKNKERLKITKEGKIYLKNNFPFYCLKRKINLKEWWWVIFDIEEISRYHRDQLRSILKKLHFIMVQKSVWVSPYRRICYRVYQYLRDNDLEGKIIILNGSFLSTSNQKTLLKKIRENLKTLNLEYKLIFEDLELSLKNYQITRDKRMLLEKFINGRKRTFEIIKKDPFFPKEYLPNPWYYNKILIIFKKIWAIVRTKNK